MFGFFKKVDKHASLMGNMAGRVGLDLGDEVAEGHLSANKYRETVMRCTQCDSVEDCQKWLKAHDSADSAPGYCRNRGLFAELKD